VEEIEFDHSHISGGLSKIQTADNVFGIFTSRAFRENGRYQIQLMKTRSSSGVGQKIDLAFDLDTLRITDVADEDGAAPTRSGSNILDSIKQRSSAQRDEPTEGSTAPKKVQVESTKLRQLLNNIGSDDII